MSSAAFIPFSRAGKSSNSGTRLDARSSRGIIVAPAASSSAASHFLARRVAQARSQACAAHCGSPSNDPAESAFRQRSAHRGSRGWRLPVRQRAKGAFAAKPGTSKPSRTCRCPIRKRRITAAGRCGKGTRAQATQRRDDFLYPRARGQNARLDRPVSLRNPPPESGYRR